MPETKLFTAAIGKCGYTPAQLSKLIFKLRKCEAPGMADSLQDCIGLILSSADSLDEDEMQSVSRCFEFSRLLMEVSKAA